ncbi:hypothetical protein POM88_042550 [Heracleum sosnowskyi]|uniref:Uncharacterized protein n=1 Tax=Heracleum sosnowskyi TaxID=360622 RepID=A0AAD8HIN6_9APIA|nr:hypothetical protein POM88_042550 [Heracleum sosnowskyi]
MNFASNNLIPLLPSKLFKFKTLIVAVLEEEVEEDHFVVEDKEEEMCQVKIQAHSKEEEEELVEVTMEEEENTINRYFLLLLLSSFTPLEYAVERLSCDTNLIPWSPRKSLFKLIITLCLPQVKEALETIHLLAGVSTGSTVINDTIFSAVKRGQVVSVAVLLLLARDRVMKSFYRWPTVSNGDCLLFPEAIMSELATLINQESALMGSKEHAKILQLCREKKELMIYFLRMIEIFNRAGPALKSYLKERTSDVTNEQVSYHVAEVLEGAGFILSTDDRDISDLTSLDSSPKPDLVPLEATLKQQGYGYILTYQP